MEIQQGGSAVYHDDTARIFVYSAGDKIVVAVSYSHTRSRTSTRTHARTHARPPSPPSNHTLTNGRDGRLLKCNVDGHLAMVTCDQL